MDKNESNPIYIKYARKQNIVRLHLTFNITHYISKAKLDYHDAGGPSKYK